MHMQIKFYMNCVTVSPLSGYQSAVVSVARLGVARALYGGGRCLFQGAAVAGELHGHGRGPGPRGHRLLAGPFRRHRRGRGGRGAGLAGPHDRHRRASSYRPLGLHRGNLRRDRGTDFLTEKHQPPPPTRNNTLRLEELVS